MLNRTIYSRWLIVVGIGLVPLLMGMAPQKTADGSQRSASSPLAKVTNPHGPLATPCENCHTATSWKPIRAIPDFNHDQTQYPLRGMHQKVGCSSCHTNLAFTKVGKLCADCHADIHRGQFGENCEQCHSVKGWQVSLDAIRNHQNRFPLVGAHAVADCAECHVNAAIGQFKGLSTACYSCHQKDYLNPSFNHVALHFSTACENCHTADSFFTASFDHLKLTGFALTGTHVTLPCIACHINNQFTATPATCYACHKADFNNTTNPSHMQLGLPQDCSTCHSTVTWVGASFDHTLYAHYPLTGMHANVACAQCHVNNSYVNTPTDCYACHKGDFAGATNPSHAGFPTDCTVCHTTSGWTQSTFDHSKSGFPLTGAHTATQCALCHVNNNFTTVPTDCYSCHTKDFTGTTNPNHVAAAFSTSCATCHTTTDWNGAVFDHSKTPFPLTGGHTTVACAQCHINNVFAGTPTDCFSCHKADFAGTTNPNHATAGYPTTCATCHTTVSWTAAAAFDHNTTKFPLSGAHTTVACALCHINNVFAGTPTDCLSCHKADFAGTTNPNHASANISTSCATCHTTVDWTGAVFDHNKTPFPLTGFHATVACAQCHINNVFAGTPTDCYSCHTKDYTGATNPNHATAGFPTACATCHTTVTWTGAVFDHNKTPFPLTGFHATVACALCHVNNVFAGTPTDCLSCHKADFAGTTNPNHASAGFSTSCATCHTTVDWTGAVFDHSKTQFPLIGGHAAVACALCHINNVFVGTPTDCYSCHTKDYTGATNPNHATAGFPTTCATCHTTVTWTGAVFDHNTTKFPLTGFHTTVACALCHVNNNFTTVPTDCYSCHTKDFTGTANPNHTTAGFSTSCATCHSTVDWTGAVFDHSKTPFPLTGFHSTVPCASCHVNNVFVGTPTDCFSCHKADFTGTTNPNHTTAGFPTTCATCHTTVTWTGAVFDHNATPFPLTGFHTTVPCTQCHVNNVFVGTPTDCFSCHKTDFTGTTNPNHAAAGFPTTCATCHTTVTWLGSVFDHNKTPFPLTGFHTTVACALCHINNVFVGTPTDCLSCHKADFAGTTNPNHTTAGFSTSCATCHTTVDWTGAVFDHNKTPFPLTGFHTTVGCALCHINNVFVGTPTDCYSCHTKDYTGATNPNHATAGFPTTCLTCHTTTTWLGAVFDHNKTPFPLTGFHTTVACTLCHINNVFVGTPTDCLSCHKADFTGTTNPNHAAAGFATTCATCHTTVNWLGAVFDHSKTPFPLTGFHTTVACALCHINNVFVGTPTDCYSCHTKDYTGATNPNHATAGFPTTCLTCHTTTNWLGAVFDHNKTPFPLTGFHATVLCASCHVNNVFVGTPTDCFSCHKADYTGTTNPNHTTAGFATTCATCHTTTNWLGAVFDHSKTPFPLTGFHTTVLCASCHINNVFVGTPTDCFSCHKADFTGTTNPNHVTSGFPTTCATCHNTTVWTTSTFNHATTTFPLTGFHLTTQCALCHVSNNYSGSLPTDCYSCHTTDFTGTTNPPHVATSLPHTCTTCHTTVDWLNASFNHAVYANYALTGLHATVACALCHVGNNYVATPTACYSCHAKDYTGTTAPAHVAAGYPTDCTICHSTVGWTTSTFNHATTTFPLTGFHITVACALCHVSGNFTTVPTDCYSCHTKDYTGTTAPAHAAAGFPTTCLTCHTTTNWLGAVFDHSKTPFPLTGFHTTVACTLCHINNVFVGTPTDCYACHKADFTGTTNPNHTTAGFPTTCVTCHTTTSWLGATFTHTWFSQTHGSAKGVCATCHTNSADYSVFTCTGCHAKTATDPHHSGVSGYVYNSVNCYACHKNAGG